MTRRPASSTFLAGLACVVALASLATLAGCSPSPSASSRRIQVAAASDLQTVLPRLIERFRDVRPGVEIVPSFGASGQFAQQIEAGAPIDLFLAANTAFVEQLAAQGLVDRASVRPYAVGALVLAVGPEVKAPIASLADLARPDVRHVALANPRTAPYGAAAREVIDRAGLAAVLEPKLAIAESVRQALQYVQTGNAEAGFVGKALARGTGLTIIDVPADLHAPIVQALGIVSRSEHREDAEAFAAFLTGEAGRALLTEHGFGLPAPTGGG